MRFLDLTIFFGCTEVHLSTDSIQMVIYSLFDIVLFQDLIHLCCHSDS